MAFSGRANFEGMGDGALRISKVVHKAVVEVNEAGAEAAAATAVIMERSASSHSFDIVANRPFFYAIRDNKLGVMLFMGWVMDPMP